MLLLTVAHKIDNFLQQKEEKSATKTLLLGLFVCKLTYDTSLVK